MIKASLFVMVGLTVLIAMGLRWREQRLDATRAATATPQQRRIGLREGWIAAQKRTLNRWVTAAAIAVVVTLVTLGGLNWLRIWQGG
jgi:hypothetical protein